MKISKNWLYEWVNPNIDTKILIQELTMSGHEVESLTPVAGEFTGVIVAEVIAIEKHPDADRLRVCTVNIGNEQLTIVCGGQNVRAGLKVPLAVIGAVLPNNFKIQKSKIRGVESQGMICSEVELGIAESSVGIMELSPDAPVGADFREYLQLNDAIIDVDLTPNRGDCLSIMGLAREVAALNNINMSPVKENKIPPQNDVSFLIKVEAEDACPSYVGRVIKNINAKAETPIWMQEKLRRSGLRTIHPVVDVTNYVMLELGQPMHGFDLEKLDQEIVVRLARKNETMTLLNDQQVTLDEKTLVIADKNKLLAIAGVMGGNNSGCDENTKQLFLESAFFTPAAVAGCARRYGLHTDSSHRFERGVDPALQVRAIERATELLLAIVGGEPGPMMEKRQSSFLPSLKQVRLMQNKIEKVLGITFTADEIESLLNRLHMETHKVAGGWDVTVPSYRFDISIDVDLIEEVMRLYGYNQIPLNYPQASLAALPYAETDIPVQRLRQCLQDRGFHEAYTYSFVDPKLQALFDPDVKPMMLTNPISAEMSVMRTNLWPGLMQAFIYNKYRQQSRIRMFELGQRFVPNHQALQQQQMLAGIITGTRYPEQWGKPTEELDFYDLKADVEAILRLSGQENKFEFHHGVHPALHPGQSSRLIYNEIEVGWLGALHPSILQQLECNEPVYVFELHLEAITKTLVPKYKPISKFPSIRRDLAVVIDKAITAAEILNTAREAAGELVTDLLIFDVYTGQGIADTKKSLAIALTLQDQHRTLVDEDVVKIMKRVITALQQQFQATLRE